MEAKSRYGKPGVASGTQPERSVDDSETRVNIAPPKGRLADGQESGWKGLPSEAGALRRIAVASREMIARTTMVAR